MTDVFVFSDNHFISNNDKPVDTDFDRLLRRKWTEAQDKDVFRYKLTENGLPSKVLSGEYQMVAQLNPNRATLRRKPEDMHSIRMPFDDQKFNFTRIKSEEVLFRIKSIDGTTEGTVIINQSPVEFCNSLLVPRLEDKRPQVLTADALRLAISLVALSGRPLKAGFNSLGAMASVNHQHFHIYYYDYDMVIERLAIEDNLIKDWPIETLVWDINEINGKQIKECVDRVIKVVDYCLEEHKNIAHNVFIGRNKTSGIRVFLWTRDPVFGAKNDKDEINPAICEFSGFFLCKTNEMFEQMDQQLCVRLLSDVKTRNEEVKHLL